MPRIPQPLAPIDSLMPGDEIRIVLTGGHACNGTLLKSGTNWLSVREGNAEVRFRTCDVETIQLRTREHIVGLVKGCEHYRIRFTDDQFEVALKVIGDWAKNPELSFDWQDASVLTSEVIKAQRK